MKGYFHKNFWQSKTEAGSAKSPLSPVGHSKAPSRNRLQIAKAKLSYSPDTFKADFHFAHRS